MEEQGRYRQLAFPLVLEEGEEGQRRLVCGVRDLLGKIQGKTSVTDANQFLELNE